MRLLKIAIAVSVVLEFVSVGLLALSKAMGFNPKLSTAEMFYGPAITIISAWIIWGIVTVFFRGKRRE